MKEEFSIQESVSFSRYSLSSLWWNLVPERARRGRRGSIFGGGMTSCRLLFLTAMLLLLLCTTASALEPDRFYLRDGTTLSGNIVGETPEAYKTLIQNTRTPYMTNVPVKSVRYVIYGSPQKAKKFLELDKAARALGACDSAKIHFLPTDAFGEAIAEAASAAHSRIWIAAYYISGGSHPMIQHFYDIFLDKAHAGLDVRVISEFGNATPMPIRNGTMNFAHTLEDDGVLVRFVQEYRVMHKKLLLIDKDKVLLGSSNLTGAGVDRSNEFNVLIESESFAQKADADFKRLAKHSHPIDELDY